MNFREFGRIVLLSSLILPGFALAAAGDSSGGGAGMMIKMDENAVGAADALLNNPNAITEALTYGDHFCDGFITKGNPPVVQGQASRLVLGYHYDICQTLPNGMNKKAGHLTILDSQTLGVDKVTHDYSFWTQPAN